MKSRHFWVLAVATALSFGQSPSAHAKPPAKHMLDPNSKTALIVLRSIWWQPAPSMKSAYKLVLSGYDAEQQKLLGGPFSGGGLFEARESNFADGYLIAEIKPGRWVFQSYSQQDRWALCFNAASMQFEVKPGEVIYLGEFDAAAHRRELLTQALSSGKGSLSSYSYADFFDLASGPRFKAIDEAQLAALRDLIARHAPKVTAPVRAVDFSPAIFGTGSTLYGSRKCGGYFAASAKGKEANAK